MRAPRYRFPDEVRSTTRRMAARMIDERTVAGSPEELDAWISRAPEIREPLERGGYGTAFTAHDLFPLLQAMLGPAGRPPSAGDPPRRASPSPWLVGSLVLLVLILLALVAAALMSAPASPLPS